MAAAIPWIISVAITVLAVYGTMRYYQAKLENAEKAILEKASSERVNALNDRTEKLEDGWAGHLVLSGDIIERLVRIETKQDIVIKNGH